MNYYHQEQFRRDTFNADPDPGFVITFKDKLKEKT
jgi:hypothetical protein